MKIRRSCAEDLDAYVRLRAQSIAVLAITHYSDTQIKDWIGDLKTDHIHALMAEGRYFVGETDDGKIICAGSWNGREITHLYVLPERARQGYGRRILHALEADYMAQTSGPYLEAESAENARGFYEKNGYVFIKTVEYISANGIRYTNSLLRKNLAVKVGSE